MGSQRQHEDKAERIQQFIDAIAGFGFPEWYAIAVFYKALHLIERMLAAKGEHTTSHRERHQILKSRFPELLRHYRPLYNYSLLCRYRFLRIQPDRDLPFIDARLQQLDHWVELEIQEG